MRIFEAITSINYNVIRRRLFQREVETAFHSGKKFSLPKIPKVNPNSLDDHKKNYIYNFYNSDNEKRIITRQLLSIESMDEIISAADKILNNKYDIIGTGEIYLGENIDWHRDYKSNYEWQKKLYWKLNYFDFSRGADITYPWELSKFNQGITLGKAYLITGEEKYTEKFLALLDSFILDNPYCTGVNWVNPSSIAERLINLLFALSFFIFSPLIDEKRLNQLNELFLYHSIYLENNLEYNSRRDHKYLINLLGLAAAGAHFKDTHYGNKNITFALSGIEQEMRNQIHADGVSYGQSVLHHPYIIEIFSLAEIIFNKLPVSVSRLYKERLFLMFEVLFNYMRSDQSVPAVGDDMPGYLLPFSVEQSKKYSANILSIGACLYNDGKMKHYAPEGSPNIIFLLGSKAFDDYKNIKAEDVKTTSIGFELGGHYILKDKDVHMFIEAGEIGKRGGGSPGHNDIFSFELFYKGKKFIVDSGTYSYFTDQKLRNELRSVKFHNTVFIDDEQLTEFAGAFKIKEDITKPKVIEWESNEEEDIFVAQHYAYTKLVDPVVCKRSIHFNKEKRIFKIKDEFFGGAVHQASFNFFFHPEISLEKAADNHFKAAADDAAIELKLNSSSEIFYSSIQDSIYSERYGRLTAAKKIGGSLKENFPAFMITEIHLK